jgi:hypothetical protein
MLRSFHNRKVSHAPIVLMFCVLTLTAFGCATQRMRQARQAKGIELSNPRPYYAATVALVSDAQFVVLSCPVAVPLPAGSELDVFRDSQKVGRVRLDPPSDEHADLVTADIVEGALQKGDTVHLLIPQPASAEEQDGQPTKSPSRPLPRRNF